MSTQPFSSRASRVPRPARHVSTTARERARLLDASRERAHALGHQLAEVAAETLWPTRCVVCDTPGRVLCPTCESALDYVDQWRACPHCGAPFGLLQCTECNSFALERMGRAHLPFCACTSAVVYSDTASAIVRTYKDQGEIRLGAIMAAHINRVIDPSWPFDVITYIPATKAAQRRRGFDHAQILAQSLAKLRGVPCIPTLEPPRTRDQRALGRRDRMRNLKGRLKAKQQASSVAQLAPRILLIDDVYTTGATLMDACDALHAAGFSEIRCATFARVY